jgi:hypothetical protein
LMVSAVNRLRVLQPAISIDAQIPCAFGTNG